MTALLLTLGIFATWWLLGLALLALVRADTTSLRVALTAPALGTCVTVLPLFLCSEAGLAIEHCAVPVVLGVVLAAVAILIVRRPAVHWGVLTVLASCLVGLLLLGGPMHSYGFDWIANANDDMANYSLSAVQLLHHALIAPFDIAGLAHDRDYVSVLQDLHLAGARPGADITLAALDRVTGLLPYEAFMPLIVAMTLSGACGAAALTMQAARRWWAAPLAAILLLVSPLATFGTVQQLMPQVWGLGLASALFALLMRPELHQKPCARIADVVPIGLLVATVVLVYVELASTLAVAYGVYVTVLAVRREIDVRAAMRLWMPAVVLLVVLLNAYLLRELAYVSTQASTGLNSSVGPPTFGYTLVPIALPGILGLQWLPSGGIGDLGINASIVIAAVILVGVVVAAAIGAARGIAAAVVIVVDLALAAVLAVHSSDFGLFKLYMYAQPFLAAGAAVLISRCNRRSLLALALGAALALMVLQLPVQKMYLDRSRDPTDLPHASAADLLPEFRRIFNGAHEPIVSVTENPTLGKLEATSIGRRPLYFISTNVFSTLPVAYLSGLGSARTAEAERAKSAVAWQREDFNLREGVGNSYDRFSNNAIASRILASGRCLIVVPTGSELAINRWRLAEGSPAIVALQCSSVHDLLAFTGSARGEGFYGPAPRKSKTLYQLEDDYFYPGKTMSGVGRYLLFRVVGQTPGARLELDFTDSLGHIGTNALPPAQVVGRKRDALPVVGEGSARVFSAPLEPQTIDGQHFLLLDLGRDGRVARNLRTGIQGVYGRSVPVDPRYLTAYLRDVSLVSAGEYADLHPPAAIASFPTSLANAELEYSGLYEDGWVGRQAYVVLAGGPVARLRVVGEVPEGAGGHLSVLVDGRDLLSRAVAAGPVNITLPVSASRLSRRVELRFSGSTRLHPPDSRPVSAHLSFLGFVPAGGA